MNDRMKMKKKKLWGREKQWGKEHSPPWGFFGGFQPRASGTKNQKKERKRGMGFYIKYPV